MKKNALLYTLVAIASMLSSCDNSNNIGSSIIEDEIVIVQDSAFTITGNSFPNKVIQSRTVTQLLGSIDAGEYGQLTSDFVTQFMPSSKIDTDGMIIDGLTLQFTVPRTTGFVGDTLVPMGLEVYRLNKPLPYPIYSNFHEEVDQYYNPDAPIASKIYKCNTIGQSDSLKALSYINIPVDLPRELAVELIDIYKKDPTSYLIPEQFAQKFPGLYVKNTYGKGRVIKIGATLMNVNYHTIEKTDADKDTTIYRVGTFYAVSPEIITNNNIRYTMSSAMQQRLNDGENLLVAPTGIDTEIQFPINQVLHSYLDGAGTLSVINSLTFSIPVDTIGNNYNITPPQNILMVRSDKRDEFFAKNMITDNITSFLGTYNSSTNSYTFPDMRNYLLECVKNGAATTEQTRFILTPVSVSTETNSSNYYYGTTTTTVKSIVPYVETPVMARILLDKAKIILSYSKQTINI